MIELSSYLEKRIAGTAESADKAVSEYNEIGKVVTVGDGIARVYGLNNVQAGEVSAAFVSLIFLVWNRRLAHFRKRSLFFLAETSRPKVFTT